MSYSNFRITTNGVLRNYRNNLMMSYDKLNQAMERVQTGRSFNSYAEDPAAASRAFQLRRSMWRTDDALENTQYIQGLFDTAFDAVDPICDGSLEHPGFGTMSEQAGLMLINDPTGDGRNALGQTLRSEAEALVQAMNCNYNGNFVFAGADGHNVPFTWGEDELSRKTLFYRGINVDTPDPEMIYKFTEEQEAYKNATEGVTSTVDIYGDDKTIVGTSTVSWTLDKVTGNITKTTTNTYTNGTPEETTSETILSPENAFLKKYGVSYSYAEENWPKLQKMAEEATYVDIGLGMREYTEEDGVDDSLIGTTVPTSAYNTALSGIKFLGFGVDEDGEPKNMVTLMYRLGEIAGRCSAEDGEYASDEDRENADVYTKKMMAAMDKVGENHVDLSTRVSYLKSNEEILTTAWDNMNETRSSIEEVDPAMAIQEMSYANYCYSAALKIGNSILSQSLMDYID